MTQTKFLLFEMISIWVISGFTQHARTDSRKDKANIVDYENPYINEFFDSSVRFIKSMPQHNPLDAVKNILVFMSSTIESVEKPKKRGPHEWNARQSLFYGSVNGCVEAAKVFFELFRASYPQYTALYLDSFNSECTSGGHAVVEVTDSDENVFIVDTTKFSSLIALVKVTEGNISRQFFSQGRKITGLVIQIPDDSDIFIKKENEHYYVTHYEYARVFDGKIKGNLIFASLPELNKYLIEYVGKHARENITFEDMKKHGVILNYINKNKTAFLYHNWCGKKLAKHIIYSCYKILPNEDIAEKIEPLARTEYKRTGKVSFCDRAKLK